MLMTVTYFWAKIYNAVENLGEKLIVRNVINDNTKLYSVGRGGFVPTRLLSGKIGVKRVGLIDTGEDNVIENNCIVVDDIYDTGATYKRLEKVIVDSKAVFACLFVRHTMLRRLPPNVVFGGVVNSNDYVIFPWESSATD